MAPVTEQTELRSHVHGMWTSVARAWTEHADYADARGADVAARLIEVTAPRPGERVLELACGAGGVGILAAQRVGPTGEVVVSDLVPELAAFAGERARAAGLANVETRALDLEEIDEPDGSYDVVLCREGLMFATDHARAAREIARVLRPGGRLGVAVWGPRAQNPWLGVVFDAVSAQVGKPVPPPGVPGPFALDDAGRLATLLSGAGLSGVVVDELPTPLRAGSFDEWWARTSALAGPIAKLIDALPDPALAALRGRLQGATREYETEHGIEFPGLSLIATGVR